MKLIMMHRHVANIDVMKRIYCVVFLCIVVCVCHIHAQTTYMGVTLDRGKEAETNCIYIFNDNADSVRVFIQYKIGNRKTEWIDYPVPQLIPPSILEPYKVGCVDSTIIGLKLLDVKIVNDHFIVVDEMPKPDNFHQEGLFKKMKSWFKKE